ncbi:hypothetical protein [Pseudomonas brenneri]
MTGLDTKVTNLDGKVTSQASSNEALRASVRGDDGSGDLAELSRPGNPRPVLRLRRGAGLGE